MFVVAEFGSSPAADGWRRLGEWCYRAQQAGADAVKVQLFRAEHFPETERDAKRPLEFPRHLLADFVDTAHRYGLRAGASVFDAEAVKLAARHCDFLKLAAREQDNHALAAAADQAAYRQHIPLYRSVSSVNGGVFVVGDAFPQIVRLGVVTRYPAPIARSLIEIVRWAWAYRDRPWGLWGWSSHARHWLDCWTARQLGASVIEKHFALSPDDVEAGHSLQPEAFGRMVKAIKSRSQL